MFPAIGSGGWPKAERGPRHLAATPIAKAAPRARGLTSPISALTAAPIFNSPPTSEHIAPALSSDLSTRHPLVVAWLATISQVLSAMDSQPSNPKVHATAAAQQPTEGHIVAGPGMSNGRYVGWSDGYRCAGCRHHASPNRRCDRLSARVLLSAGRRSVQRFRSARDGRGRDHRNRRRL